MPVPAFTSAPIASNSSSISNELKRSVPLNSRCSRKCEIPAWSVASLREPVRIQKPRAMERTEGMPSVTTRTPEPTSVSRGSAVTCGSAVAATAVAATPVAALTPPAATAAAARAAVARAHGGELLGRLAGDLGVVREAQADAAALGIDLDHLDRRSRRRG